MNQHHSAQPPPPDDRLSAYLDGELSAAEKVEMEQLIANDPRYQRLADDLLRLQAELRRLPEHQLSNDLTDRVLREAERVSKKLGTESTSSQRTPFWQWSLASGVACAAAGLLSFLLWTEPTQQVAFQETLSAPAGEEVTTLGGMFDQADFSEETSFQHNHIRTPKDNPAADWVVTIHMVPESVPSTRLKEVLARNNIHLAPAAPPARGKSPQDMARYTSRRSKRNEQDFNELSDNFSRKRYDDLRSKDAKIKKVDVSNSDMILVTAQQSQIVATLRELQQRTDDFGHVTIRRSSDQGSVLPANVQKNAGSFVEQKEHPAVQDEIEKLMVDPKDVATLDDESSVDAIIQQPAPERYISRAQRQEIRQFGIMKKPSSTDELSARSSPSAEDADLAISDDSALQNKQSFSQDSELPESTAQQPSDPTIHVLFLVRTVPDR